MFYMISPSKTLIFGKTDYEAISFLSKHIFLEDIDEYKSTKESVKVKLKNGSDINVYWEMENSDLIMFTGKRYDYVFLQNGLREENRISGMASLYTNENIKNQRPFYWN